MVATLTALVLRILSNPAANVLQKRLTHSMGAVDVNFRSFLVLGLACVPFAFDVEWSAFGAAFWCYCALAAVCGAAGNAFLVVALRDGELSLLGPVNSYKPVVAVVASFFMFGTLPGVWSAAGIFLIIFGTHVVLGGGKGGVFSALADRRIRFRFYALFLTALEAVFIKKIIPVCGAWAAFYIWAWGGAVFSAAFLCAENLVIGRRLGVGDCAKKCAAKTAGGGWLQILLLAVLFGVMQISTNFVFENMDVGAALALFQLSTVVSVVFGALFFGERHFVRRLSGSAIMCAGAVVVLCA